MATRRLLTFLTIERGTDVAIGASATPPLASDYSLFPPVTS